MRRVDGLTMPIQIHGRRSKATFDVSRRSLYASLIDGILRPASPTRSFVRNGEGVTMSIIFQAGSYA